MNTLNSLKRKIVKEGESVFGQNMIMKKGYLRLVH